MCGVPDSTVCVLLHWPCPASESVRFQPRSTRGCRIAKDVPPRGELGRAGREQPVYIKSCERGWGVGRIPYDLESSFGHPLFHHPRLCNGSIRVASDRESIVVVTHDPQVAIVRRLTSDFNSAVGDPNSEPDRACALAPQIFGRIGELLAQREVHPFKVCSCQRLRDLLPCHLDPGWAHESERLHGSISTPAGGRATTRRGGRRWSRYEARRSTLRSRQRTSAVAGGHYDRGRTSAVEE